MNIYTRSRSPRRWATFIVALIFVFELPTPAFASTEPCATPKPLADGWNVVTPQAAGFDASMLCALLTEIAIGDANIHSIVIERRGQLLADLYRIGRDISINSMYGLWRPFAPKVAFDPTMLHDTRSVSKSVVSLLLGIAIEQGKIKALSTPVLDFYPEFAHLRTPERSAITLAHLLTMTSGLQWDEGSLPSDETQLFWKRSLVEFVMSRPIANPPGERFHYNSGGTAVLADILVRVTGTTLKTLAQTQLFEPLGITNWEWVTDFHHRELAFTGLRLRPRDMAKLGRLLLNYGQWQGKQIVPSQWIAASMRAHVATEWPRQAGAAYPSHYGYQWWVGTVDWRGKPIAWAAAFGNGGQRIFVLPELDITVVVTAGDYGSAPIAMQLNQWLTRIVAAVRE